MFVLLTATALQVEVHDAQQDILEKHQLRTTACRLMNRMLVSLRATFILFLHSPNSGCFAGGGK